MLLYLHYFVSRSYLKINVAETSSEFGRKKHKTMAWEKFTQYITSQDISSINTELLNSSSSSKFFSFSFQNVVFFNTYFTESMYFYTKFVYILGYGLDIPRNFRSDRNFIHMN